MSEAIITHLAAWLLGFSFCWICWIISIARHRRTIPEEIQYLTKLQEELARK